MVILDESRARVSNLLGAGPTAKEYASVAIGTGVTAAAVTDTRLTTEIITGGGSRRSSPYSTRTSGGAQTNVTITQVTTSVTNDTCRWDTTFTFTSSFAVTEVAVVDDSTVPSTTTTKQGTYLFHQVFSAINVISGDTLRILADVRVA